MSPCNQSRVAHALLAALLATTGAGQTQAQLHAAAEEHLALAELHDPAVMRTEGGDVVEVGRAQLSGLNPRRQAATIGPDGAVAFAFMEDEQKPTDLHKLHAHDTPIPELDPQKPDPPNAAATLLQDSEATSEDSALPPWAMMLIGSVASAVLVILTLHITACITSPLRGLNDKDKIEEELRAANEQAQALRERLEAKRAEDARAAAVAAGTEGPGAAAPPPPQPEVLVGEMLARTQDLDQTVSSVYHQAADQATPLMARADHAVATFQEGIKTIQKNVEEVATKEATAMVDNMQKALGQEEHELPQWLKDSGHDRDPPPVALLVAGLFSPVLLRLAQSQSQTSLKVNFMFDGLAAVVLILDREQGCKDPKVWLWMFGFITINFVETVCNWLVISRADAAREELREQEEKRLADSTGNAVWDAFNALQNNAGAFFSAMHKYNVIVGAWSYCWLRLAGGVAIAWGGFGLYITIANVVQDSTECDAKSVVFFLHSYSFYFTMFLVFKVGALVYWIVSLLFGCSCVNKPMLGIAKSVDDEMPAKLPVMMTFMRAFFMQTKTDVFQGRSLYLRQQISDMEKDRVQLLKQAEQYEKQIAGNNQEVEQIDGRQQPAGTDEQSFVETYQARMRDVLDTVQPAVALLASAGKTADTSGRTAAATVVAKGKGRGERQPARPADALDF